MFRKMLLLTIITGLNFCNTFGMEQNPKKQKPNRNTTIQDLPNDCKVLILQHSNLLAHSNSEQQYSNDFRNLFDELYQVKNLVSNVNNLIEKNNKKNNTSNSITKSCNKLIENFIKKNPNSMYNTLVGKLENVIRTYPQEQRCETYKIPTTLFKEVLALFTQKQKEKKYLNDFKKLHDYFETDNLMERWDKILKFEDFENIILDIECDIETQDDDRYYDGNYKLLEKNITTLFSIFSDPGFYKHFTCCFATSGNSTKAKIRRLAILLELQTYCINNSNKYANLYVWAEENYLDKIGIGIAKHQGTKGNPFVIPHINSKYELPVYLANTKHQTVFSLLIDRTEEESYLPQTHELFYDMTSPTHNLPNIFNIGPFSKIVYFTKNYLAMGQKSMSSTSYTSEKNLPEESTKQLLFLLRDEKNNVDEIIKMFNLALNPLSYFIQALSINKNHLTNQRLLFQKDILVKIYRTAKKTYIKLILERNQHDHPFVELLNSTGFIFDPIKVKKLFSTYKILPNSIKFLSLIIKSKNESKEKYDLLEFFIDKYENRDTSFDCTPVLREITDYFEPNNPNQLPLYPPPSNPLQLKREQEKTREGKEMIQLLLEKHKNLITYSIIRNTIKKLTTFITENTGIQNNYQEIIKMLLDHIYNNENTSEDEKLKTFKTLKKIINQTPEEPAWYHNATVNHNTLDFIKEYLKKDHHLIAFLNQEHIQKEIRKHNEMEDEK